MLMSGPHTSVSPPKMRMKALRNSRARRPICMMDLVDGVEGEEVGC